MLRLQVIGADGALTVSQDIFDVAIVGAGSAGCVLANRLSADLKTKIVLIEAGGRDNWIWFHVPAGYLFAIGNPRADWMFKTEPIAGLNGRAIAYPRGKVIGGSSAINAMIYMRGQAGDYDSWRQMGLSGWGWDDVLPYFKKGEDHFSGASEHHGAGGEWRIEPARMRWEILDAFAKAAREVGIPSTDDFNRGNNEGCGYFHVNQKSGRRWSAARGFLKPILNRPNLKLVTGALVNRVAFDGKKAVGVIIDRFGFSETIPARKIILCAGAVATPAILERSGIGDGERLRALGIPIVHHLPGVGENLQDHLQLRCIFKVSGARTMNTRANSFFKRAGLALEYLLTRGGPLSMAPSQLGAFARSSGEYERPNLQFHVQPLSLDKFGDPLHAFPAFTVSVCNLRPTSRGSIHARSLDAKDAPIIAPNYLSTPEDRRIAADAIRLARRIVAAPALKRYSPEELKPGAHLSSDAELARAAGDIGTTIFHPVGTAKMGTASDPLAVVDAALNVYGVEDLRIADASVMPLITSGNTAAPTMMIAEKAASMLTTPAAG
jgi:choline dehydrogenase